MIKFTKYLERFLIGGILIVMSIILILAFVDIVITIKKQILVDSFLNFDAGELMNLFSVFLVLLIGLELLETVKAYLKDDIVHVEFIILVAIIAIARKVIVWDFDRYSTYELLSLAGMMMALGATYFLIKKAEIKFKVGSHHKENKDTSKTTPKE